VAIRRLQKDKLIGKAMVVDCDVHHGNGTAAIFASDPTVFTLSIHQFNNYPELKPPSNLDIDLEDGVRDEEYLERLAEGYLPAIEKFRPDLLMYVAGADPFHEDQLGGLMLTLDGLRLRDELVLRTAVERKVPAVVTLAGGYARKVEDTVTIQSGTAKVAAALLL
jgi:acetoin utilization deacetylase AcuC-like enzyme